MDGICAEESDRGKEIGRERLEERGGIRDGRKGLTTAGRGVRVTAVISGRGGGGGGCTTAYHSQQPPFPFQTNKSKFKYSCE